MIWSSAGPSSQIQGDHHKAAGKIILSAALTSGSLLWNELVVLERTNDRDLLADERLIKIRRVVANRLQTMAEAVSEEQPVEPPREPSLDDGPFPTDPRKAEYLNTLLSRYKEVESIMLKLPARAEARFVARAGDATTTNP